MMQVTNVESGGSKYHDNSLSGNLSPTSSYYKRMNRLDSSKFKLSTEDFYLPKRYEITISDGTSRIYYLSYIQRLFITFELHGSCGLASVISRVVGISIIISIIAYILASFEEFR